MNNNISKENIKGITLIALVVSIIILFILAGTAITALSRRQWPFTKKYRSKDTN